MRSKRSLVAFADPSSRMMFPFDLEEHLVGSAELDSEKVVLDIRSNF